jgi:hypothetical protein
MFDRSTTTRSRLGYSTLVIALATMLTAGSMFFASAVDVKAMLRPDQAAARAMGPVELPQEWQWRGPKPINLESMYGNKPAPRLDFIRNTQ